MAPARKLPPVAPNRDEPQWRVWTAPAALVSGFILGQFAYLVVAVIGQGRHQSLNHPGPAVSIAGNVVYDLSFVAAALYFARLQGRVRAADFGYRRTALGLGAGGFVAGGAAYYVFSALYTLLLHLHSATKLPDQLGANRSTAALVAVAAFVCVIAPICEELFFRGFLFGTLRRLRITIARRSAGTWTAAILTGILFGAAHIGSEPVPQLVQLAFLGFVLCLIRWRTGSLYPCMALHSFNNSLALGVIQHWSPGATLALTTGSMLAIGVLTGPLSGFRARSCPT